MQVALDVDATGHGEQSQQQDDERNVIQKHQVDDFVDGRRHAMDDAEGHDDQQRPDCRDLAEMVMPEVWHRERHDGDRQQDAGKRRDPQQAELAPVDCRCVGAGCKGWEGGKGEQRDGEGERREGGVAFHGQDMYVADTPPSTVSVWPLT